MVVIAGDSRTTVPHPDTQKTENTLNRAELIFGVLVTLLQSPQAYTKFISVLPMPRICLLLLGETPTSTTAVNVLRLIETSVKNNPSFSRKFELVSGWNIIKNTLPSAWSPEVQSAAFNILLQSAAKDLNEQYTVLCPSIINSILASLFVEPQVASTWLARQIGPNAHRELPGYMCICRL